MSEVCIGKLLKDWSWVLVLAAPEAASCGKKGRRKETGRSVQMMHLVFMGIVHCHCTVCTIGRFGVH